MLKSSKNGRLGISRVTDLCERLLTSSSEIAASVHLVANELLVSSGEPPSATEVRDEVLRWKARRRPPLSPKDVLESVESLAVLKWIDVRPDGAEEEDDDGPSVPKQEFPLVPART